jgi:2-oxoglutarate ferredoxin oxidoreductase subunit alpha
MTATSGPGFSLKQENIGFACIAEVPCVIVNVMRGGPSTGMPTMPAQGDVMQARWGTHGDHPIIALAPWSVRETYDATVMAVNYAERFRTPVVLLMDAIVAQLKEKVELPGTPRIVERPMPSEPPAAYKPFAFGNGEVAPLAPFGFWPVSGELTLNLKLFFDSPAPCE